MVVRKLVIFLIDLFLMCMDSRMLLSLRLFMWLLSMVVYISCVFLCERLWVLFLLCLIFLMKWVVVNGVGDGVVVLVIGLMVVVGVGMWVLFCMVEGYIKIVVCCSWGVCLVVFYYNSVFVVWFLLGFLVVVLLSLFLC